MTDDPADGLTFTCHVCVVCQRAMRHRVNNPWIDGAATDAVYALIIVLVIVAAFSGIALLFR